MTFNYFENIELGHVCYVFSPKIMLKPRITENLSRTVLFTQWC